MDGMRIVIFALILTFAGKINGQEDQEACISRALADTDPNNAVGDALSNAVAQAMTQVILCGDERPDASSVSGLSIAVALAISESRAAGETCTADAEANAEEVARLVGENAGGGLAAGLTDNLEGDSLVMANAWLDARGQDIVDIIEQAESTSPSVLSSEGCLDLSALANGLPTAIELGSILEDAIGQILRATQCGTNLEPSEEECTWENRKFKGKCVSVDPAAVPPKKDCNEEFKQCKKSKPSWQCFLERRDCQKAARRP
ncbi:hypothetical protein BSKO_10588 [Bryopsis sp. KO-2023]|nr:hypothetical protein BSKO_10588 [Bryopsis sp. KO-2023]